MQKYAQKQFYAGLAGYLENQNQQLYWPGMCACIIVQFHSSQMIYTGIDTDKNKLK